jgi:hypothetical protein
LKQYESNFNKWRKYCTENDVSVWKPSINNILSFLALLYDQGLGYTSVNSMRSCLSTMIGKLEGQDIGSHPLICRLVKGVANSRPPKPKYEQTWDPSLVLNYCKNLGDNISLSLYDMSLKLVG